MTPSPAHNHRSGDSRLISTVIADPLAAPGGGRGGAGARFAGGNDRGADFGRLAEICRQPRVGRSLSVCVHGECRAFVHVVEDVA
jgi:hypothetical protein